VAERTKAPSPWRPCDHDRATQAHSPPHMPLGQGAPLQPSPPGGPEQVANSAPKTQRNNRKTRNRQPPSGRRPVRDTTPPSPSRNRRTKMEQTNKQVLFLKSIFQCQTTYTVKHRYKFNASLKFDYFNFSSSLTQGLPYEFAIASLAIFIAMSCSLLQLGIEAFQCSATQWCSKTTKL